MDGAPYLLSMKEICRHASS